MSESISFDRAADFYDATRALPDEVATKLTETLLAELSNAGADRLFEVGVGTGRISRPLMARGIRVHGVDISTQMMGRLRAQLSGEHTQPDLMLGDATRLPVATDSVPAALIVHVLHLVSSMPEAVAELARAIRPDGVFLRDTTRYPEGEAWQASMEIWNEALAPHNYERRRRPERAEIHGELKSHGATLRVESYATRVSGHTPREHLKITRNRVNSWTWEFPDDLFEAVYAEFEPKFIAHYSDMDAPLEERLVHELEVWTFP